MPKIQFRISKELHRRLNDVARDINKPMGHVLDDAIHPDNVLRAFNRRVKTPAISDKAPQYTRTSPENSIKTMLLVSQPSLDLIRDLADRTELSCDTLVKLALEAHLQ